VNLYHHGAIEQLRRVALDTSSRTSVALLKTLLRERLGRDPEYLEMAPSVPEMLEAADAALVIGDRALDYVGDVPRLDLGAEWQRQTGLPFVYAFWAGPRGAVSAEDVARLQQALRAGLANLAAIAASYNGHGQG
jgi:chorismate dehydratase